PPLRCRQYAVGMADPASVECRAGSGDEGGIRMGRLRTRRHFAAGLALAGLLAAAAAPAAIVEQAGAAHSVRGFDGTTIKVAGIGIQAQFGQDPIGAKARIKRFNDTNEIKGVKIDYVEFADDKQDQATALSEARRLVTQDQVFAIVGDVSQFNPGDYFKQQHVPYFGFAFDNSYCSSKPDPTIWGFGFNGCLVPTDPSVMPDGARNDYTYVSKKTGKKHPTAAIFSNDTDSGRSATKFQSIVWKGAGFKVVATNNQMPIPPIADYTPYAQAMLTADNGKPPDVIFCALATDCIPMWSLIKANGYQGTYISSLYADVLLKAMAGSVTNTLFVPVSDNNPGMNQLKQDVDAIQPGASSKIDTGTMAGYLSTDMFI